MHVHARVHVIAQYIHTSHLPHTLLPLHIVDLPVLVRLESERSKRLTSVHGLERTIDDHQRPIHLYTLVRLTVFVPSLDRPLPIVGYE